MTGPDTLKAHGPDESGGERPARIFLSVYHGDDTHVVPLVEPVVLGRAAPSTLVIDDPQLSRTHCRFSANNEVVTVEDLGSTNGTLVNGVRVEVSTISGADEVAAGDVAIVVNIVRARRRRSPVPLEEEEWLDQVDRELARASSFGRTAAVLAMRFAYDGAAETPSLSAAAAKMLRPIDSCGGSDEPEEVLILLPEADQTQAKEAGDRLILGLMSAGFIPRRMGIAVYPKDGAAAEDLLAAARGKSAGSSPYEVFRYPVEGREMSIADRAMIRVAEAGRKLASSTLPVLIQGETGAGKDLMAELIHFAGPRKDRPFVRVNCGSLTPAQGDSDLFAQVFLEVDGGTILLNEIADLAKELQARLVRVLEVRKVARPGSAKEVDVDLRIIAATNRDLAACVEEGTFRRDLLYRLNAATLYVPPLRERPADISVVADSVLERARRSGEKVGGLRPEALERLRTHDWPGNVRELVNAIEHALLLADGDPIGPEHLGGRIRASSASGSDHRSRLRRVEEEMIRAALKKTGGNQSEAARLLKMPRRTFVHKMRALGIR